MPRNMRRNTFEGDGRHPVTAGYKPTLGERATAKRLKASSARMETLGDRPWSVARPGRSCPPKPQNKKEIDVDSPNTGLRGDRLCHSRRADARCSRTGLRRR